jgi:outer membrane protein assembly factor BamB
MLHRFLRLACVLLVLSVPTFAADWPQFRGPDRTGISKETGLLKKWPRGGPKLLWSSDKLGIGYSGPSIVGNRLYIMSGDKTSEYLDSLDVKSGKRLWSVEIGDFYENGYGSGPRGTPTVEGGFVYALGGQGKLICVSADKGNKVWSVDLVNDLGGVLPRWGYTESPLVDGDRVVCTPGGEKGTLAALDKKNGKVVWRSKDWTDEANYSSVVVATPHKTRQYVQMASASVSGVDAKTGKLMWRFPRTHRITVPTVITTGNFVYITSGYGVGCNLLELTSATEYREVYDNKNMVNHHGGVILLGGHVYGYSDNKGWVCQDFKSGDVVWSWRKFPKGSLVYADGCFYCYSQDDGTLALIEASTEGWKEKGRFKIAAASKMPRPRVRTNVWTHPVVANGRLYLRDQEMLFCYDVKNASAP